MPSVVFCIILKLYLTSCNGLLFQHYSWKRFSPKLQKFLIHMMVDSLTEPGQPANLAVTFCNCLIDHFLSFNDYFTFRNSLDIFRLLQFKKIQNKSAEPAARGLRQRYAQWSIIKENCSKS